MRDSKYSISFVFEYVGQVMNPKIHVYGNHFYSIFGFDAHSWDGSKAKYDNSSNQIIYFVKYKLASY